MKKRRSIVAAIALILSSSASVYAADKIVTNDSGEIKAGSFRQVLLNAATGDTIRFGSGIDSILLGGVAVNDEADSLRIIGPDQGVILDGNYTSPILRLNTGETRLENLAVVNAFHEGVDVVHPIFPVDITQAGGVNITGDNDTTVSVVNSMFLDNRTYVKGATAQRSNLARGGAFYLGNDKQQDVPGSNMLAIDSSAFVGNRLDAFGYDDVDTPSHSADPSAFGGAIFSAGTPTITNSWFSGNAATAFGGIASEYYDEDADKVYQASASASAAGGVLFSYGNELPVLIESSTFDTNFALAIGGTATGERMGGIADASAMGGAIYLSAGNSTVRVVGSEFNGDEVQATGGNAEAPSTVFAFGGAIGIYQAEGTLEIVDSTFTDNRAVAMQGQNNPKDEISARGGAIDYNVMFLDSTVTLSATEGNQTVFSGNKAIESRLNDEGEREETVRANSINFTLFERDMDPEKPSPIIHFNVRPEVGGLVALDDPISSTVGTILDMKIDGQGLFRWGGENVFGDGSDTSIDFVSGTTILSPDFTVKTTSEKFLVSLKVNMREDAMVVMNLTGRDQNLAMFQSLKFNDEPDDESVYEFNVDNAKLAAFSYTLDATAGTKYLVTDDRQEVVADNFVVVADPHGWYQTTVTTEGKNLYVELDNSGAIAPFRNSANGNVRNAYRNGNMAGVFNNLLAGYGPIEQAIIFNEFRNNSQLLVPEAVATQAIAAMDYANYVDRALWQLTNHRNGDTSFGGCDPCAAVCGSKGKARHLWGGYIGNTAEQDDSDGYFGYRAKMDGAIVGFDKDLNRRWNAGAFFSYGSGVNRYDSLGSKIDTKAYQTGLYGTWTPNRNWSVRFDTSYGHFDNDFARWNMLGTSNGGFAQDLFDIGGLAKRDFRVGKSSKLSPYFGMRYMYLSQQSTTEWGTNPFASRIAGDHLNSFATTLGAAFSTDVKYRKTVWTPTLYADWRHEFADTQYTTGARYLNGGTWYELNSVDRARDSADLGFNLMTSWKGRQGWIWDVQVGYNANLTTDFTSQAYYATLGFRF